MPTIGIFHTKFWEFSDTNFPHASTTVGGGYPAWQAAVITPSLVGIVGAWIDARWELLKWHWRFAVRVHRLSYESRGVLSRALTSMESPAYPKAQAAVRRTATTLGFMNDPNRAEVIKYMKDTPGRVENVYRHLHARKALSAAAGSTLANHELNFLTELAYQGFTITRK